MVLSVERGHGGPATKNVGGKENARRPSEKKPSYGLITVIYRQVVQGKTREAAALHRPRSREFAGKKKGLRRKIPRRSGGKGRRFHHCCCVSALPRRGRVDMIFRRGVGVCSQKNGGIESAASRTVKKEAQ